MFWIYSISSLKIFWTVLLALLCLIDPTSNKHLLALLVFLIVASDIADGRIAEFFKFNNAKRRLFDNFSDIIITHIAYLAIIYFLKWDFAWYIPLIGRDFLLLIFGITVLSRNKIVVFPGIIHKLGRLSLPIAAIAMLENFYGQLFLSLALLFFFIILLDYYGYFIIYLIKRNQDDKGIIHKEVHLNSSLNGVKFIIKDNQELLLKLEKMGR